MSNNTQSPELQMALAQVEAAAMQLDVNQAAREFLVRATEHRFSFTFLVDRTLACSEAYLSSLWPRPSRGGMSLGPAVTAEQAKALALVMRAKHGLYTDPEWHFLEGGGHLGVRLNRRELTDDEYVFALRSLARALGDRIGRGRQILAPDAGTDARTMAMIMDERAEMVGLEPDAFAGKPPLWGGRVLRERATGFGGAIAVEEAARSQRMPLKGAKVAVAGFGAVGAPAAGYLARLGASVVAASTPNGAIAAKRLDVPALEQHILEGNDITTFRGGEPMLRDELYGLDVHALVLAGTEIVDEQTARTIRAPLVCEVTRAMSVDADRRLVDHGTLVIPDLVGGGLGAYCSGHELRGTDPGSLDRLLENKARHVYFGVHRAAEERGVSLRTAAWTLGLERVLEQGRDSGRVTADG